MYYSKSTDNPWPGSKDNSQWINTIIIIINTYHSLSILDIKSFYTIDSRSSLWKRQFLDILVVFRLDLGQITFNLVNNALASWQLGFLATGIVFCDILTHACLEIKILR